MHGRKRQVLSPEQQADANAVLQKKIQSYKKLSSIAFKNFNDKNTSFEAYDLNGQLLCINPDVYSLWNHRKEIILHQLKDELHEQQDSNSSTIIPEALSRELKVTQDAIKRNSKSYNAWHHRKWIIELCKSHVNFLHEVELTNQFLLLDERNFHCWNYRRWIVSQSNTAISAESELEFTLQLIQKNFSNYSAWHYRSILLEALYSNNNEASSLNELVSSELQLLQQAIYTEPFDQSCWFYHNWLQTFILSKLKDGEMKKIHEIFQQEIDSLQELILAEPTCKWPYITILNMFDKLRKQNTPNQLPLHSTFTQVELIEKLIQIDNNHIKYYEHRLAQLN
jgi:geranylgeranyl transferase type-2 subunit alpha